MENQQGSNGSFDRDWRSQNFRDGITSQIQQAVVHCVKPQPLANNARDLETRAYSRSSSKAEYIDFVGQVIIRLNVVGNGNRAIGGPALEHADHDDDDEGNLAIPSGQLNRSLRHADVTGRKRNVSSFQTTLVHKVDLGHDHPDTVPVSNSNAQEENFAETEASGDTKGEETEVNIKSKKGRVQCAADDVMGYILRLVREDREKQTQELVDCYQGDMENTDLKEKKQAINKFMDECMAKVTEISSCRESDEEVPSGLPTESNPVPAALPPSYLCDQWSHQIYKDPVVAPSGFTYERSGIEDHLKNVGEYDPITRVKLTADLLLPNHAMKKLVEAYMSNKLDSP